MARAVRSRRPLWRPAGHPPPTRYHHRRCTPRGSPARRRPPRVPPDAVGSSCPSCPSPHLPRSGPHEPPAVGPPAPVVNRTGLPRTAPGPMRQTAGGTADEEERVTTLDDGAGRLGPAERAAALGAMAGTTFDVVVVGGGVVGAGAALDAATRGLSVALLEARDWASGTSSRSSKLIHGGLRYLEML